MSESSFPFEGQTMTQASQDEFSEAGGGGDRTKLLLLAGVAVVLVLAGAVYFLLFSGSDGEEVAAPVGKPVAAAPQPAPAPPVSTPVKSERLSAKSFGNDPFEALITEPVEATGSAAVASITGPMTATPVTVGVPATPAVPVPVPVTAPVPAPVTSAPAETKAHTFRVVEVGPSNGSVDVKVDGELYKNLTAGEVFGTYFKVVLISGSVNSFQFGEEKFNVIGTKRLTIA